MKLEGTAGFMYGSAGVILRSSEPSLLDGIRGLYADFASPRRDLPWQYDVVPNSLGGVRLSVGGETVHDAGNEEEALSTLDWCVSSHLLADAVPAPVVLHSAAVGMPAGGTVLIAAPSGGGKSTLTAALVRRGCLFLSDEFVPIEPHSLRPLAYPRALGLKAGSRALGPPWHLPAPRLRPAQRGDAVRTIVLCQFLPGHPTLIEKLRRTEALARLLGQAPLLSQDRARGFAALAALVDRTPTFRLIYGLAEDAAARLCRQAS
jgi:hypothetical protein